MNYFFYLPIATNATILTTDIGGSHSETKASTAYCANERQIIAIWDGFNTNVDTHENKNAGAGPNASIKYAHSAPDDVFIVPNSAYARAPAEIKNSKFNKKKKKKKETETNKLNFSSEILLLLGELDSLNEHLFIGRIYFWQKLLKNLLYGVNF